MSGDGRFVRQHPLDSFVHAQKLKIDTDGNEHEYPLVVLCMSVLSCISPVIVRNSFVRCIGVIRWSVRKLELERIRHA